MMSRASVAFAFALVVPACSNTDTTDTGDSGTSGTSGVGNDDFPGAAAAVVCEFIFDCDCPDPGHADEAACVAALEEAARFDHEKAQNFGLTYDPLCGQAVLDAHDQRGCSISVVPLPSSCALPCRRYVGAKQSGEQCTEVYLDWHDCAQGLGCETDAMGMRRCVDPCGVGLPEGDACLDAMFQELGTCIPGLYCDRESLLCESYPAPGEPCGGQMTCDPDSFCDATGTPVCASKRPVGEACSYPDWCTADAYCDTGSGLCVELPGPGQACAPGAACDLYSACVNQMCEAGEAIACTGLDALAG